jgi:hypothetical protein
MISQIRLIFSKAQGFCKSAGFKKKNRKDSVNPPDF